MTRVRIAGVVLMVVLGAGLLTWITDRAGVPPKNPARAPVEIRAEGIQPVTETVDLRNGNLHVEIPRSVAANEESGKQVSYPDSEAYAVYSVVAPALAQDVIWRIPQVFVIQASTMPQTRGISQCFPSRYQHEFATAPQNFSSINSRAWLLLNSFPFRRPYNLVSERNFDELQIRHEGHQLFRWEEFYKRFPGASSYFAFSGVGFNPSKTRAVVSVALHCGPLCGAYTSYLLRKHQGTWKIVPISSSCGSVS